MRAEQFLYVNYVLQYVNGHAVYDHNIQTSSSLKLLGQSKPNFMWSILGKGE